MIRLTTYVLNSVAMRLNENMETVPDNMRPLTYDEIIENFDHVFKNPFETRTMVGKPWNVFQELKRHDTFYRYNSNYYTKGYYTCAILLDSKGEKDFVKFWKQYKNGRWEYGYSFTKRDLCKEILN